jgi:hypothetical protein
VGAFGFGITSHVVGSHSQTQLNSAPPPCAGLYPLTIITGSATSKSAMTIKALLQKLWRTGFVVWYAAQPGGSALCEDLHQLPEVQTIQTHVWNHFATYLCSVYTYAVKEKQKPLAMGTACNYFNNAFQQALDAPGYASTLTLTLPVTGSCVSVPPPNTHLLIGGAGAAGAVNQFARRRLLS